MNRTSLLKDFSNKILKYRESSGYSKKTMAGYFGVSSVNYKRYEEAMIFPTFWGLYYLAMKTGISLDWLVCDRGPTYYKEEEEKKAQPVKEAKPQSTGEIMDEEIKDLVEHMERIPLLRHEILVSFYTFKEKHKKMVEEAG